MKYLITGASGFVGGHLLSKLMHEEQAEIIALYNSSKPQNALYPAPNVRWEKCNIVTEECGSLLDGVDVVIHLAALSSVSSEPEICSQLHLVNVTGTRRIAEAAKNKGVSRFIFVSSIAAGETAKEVIVNEANGVPVSCYGESKKEAEDMLLGMQDQGFNVTVLRPTALFGENHLGSVYELVRLIKRKRFVLIGDGRNRTNFFYIGDFVHDIYSVIHNPKTYGRVFVSADQPCELRDLVAQIKRGLGIPGKDYRVPLFIGSLLGLLADVVSGVTGRSLPLSRRRVRAMTRDVIYSSENLRTILGNDLPFGLDQGMRNTISWYRDAGLLDTQ